MLEIFYFLSFKDLITPVGGEAIYSGFGSKNIGMMEDLVQGVLSLGVTGITSYHQFHNTIKLLHYFIHT